jgi:N-methylhydantoinase A
MSYRIGIDIGGTFTDFVVADGRHNVHLWKEDSTPGESTLAIKKGLTALSEQLGLSLADFFDQTSLLVHGTTIATNTVIQRNGPDIGLLCTEGFRDVLYFRDGFKPERFNIHLPHPHPFVDRWLRLGVTERISADGEVVTPLAENDVRAAAAAFREAGAAAVAVAFLWAVLNPEHEQRAAEILREELPGVPVIEAAEVLPEIREWERTSAAALSAYIAPGIDLYLQELKEWLKESGYSKPPMIMQINGGCSTVDEIVRKPVYALASGPAAAPAAGIYFAGQESRDLITVDMGGTSFDVCLIRDGRPAMSKTIQVEGQPIGVTGVDTHSVGAGGGSIGWVDSGGALRMGPQSAGSRPGPACYDQGGTEPTVTDANVVLGYLAPDGFLGGRRTLRDDLSRKAVEEKVAEPLGLEVQQAAAGMLRVVDANMVGAIRTVSVERGIDPRGFTMVSGGGAGGLHATRIARELGIDRVLVPQAAGVFCAFGMTVTDVQHDFVRPLHGSSETIDPTEVDELIRGLEDRGRSQLLEEGLEPDQVILERWAEARYAGQIHELRIPVPGGVAIDDGVIAEVVDAFHAQHEELFTYARRDLPIEFQHWRVVATGSMPVKAAGGREQEGEADPKIGSRDAYFGDAEGVLSMDVYDAARLRAGNEITGPALIQAPTTTVLLSPGDRLRVRDDSGYDIAVATKEEVAAATAASEAMVP